MLDEKTPLLQHNNDTPATPAPTMLSIPRRISHTISGTFRVIVSTFIAPGKYLIACFYDEEGRFSAVLPVYRLGHRLSRNPKRKRKQPVDVQPTSGAQSDKVSQVRPYYTPGQSPVLSTVASGISSSVAISEPETDVHDGPERSDTPSRHTRSKSASSTTSEDSESSFPKRSIRIKTFNGDALRQRKQKRDQREKSPSNAHVTSSQPTLTVETLKSPTRPTSPARAASLTKYPCAPAPPRPLIPKRQPSYTLSNPPAFDSPQKTLIIDLDETLIHSMAKGGRMSTGHMVEVKLQMPVGIGGSVVGPQVPILYYVHKRPHCDEFLRKVSKWFNLIVFTASVQAYADPVIDWLELERKYFSARYYRQHCTLRNGAYIKDLSQVEPDLSKVMILDNSPMSYIFHEDNAIPIEGWISDPTDNDLLHLVPLLEGLQYTTDVRALLALRLGESSA